MLQPHAQGRPVIENGLYDFAQDRLAHRVFGLCPFDSRRIGRVFERGDHAAVRRNLDDDVFRLTVLLNDLHVRTVITLEVFSSFHPGKSINQLLERMQEAITLWLKVKDNE